MGMALKSKQKQNKNRRWRKKDTEKNNKPKSHYLADDHLVSPPWRVASQLNAFISVEVEIIMVADTKNAPCVKVYTYCEGMSNSYNKT